MKLYVLRQNDLDAPWDRVSPTLSLKSLLYETDFSDEEVDTIASMMVGDIYMLDNNDDSYLAVKRVS